MTTNVPFWSTPFSGYVGRDVPAEDPELTHVGPGTPCGEWLRRFWQPVAVSEELKDLPKYIRIMGEDLVVFRDGRGQVGLLAQHCSHRGASLEFGQIQKRGIRCCYHSWLYDVDGKVLETPGEPPDSPYKDRLYHPAYPTLEYVGLVFAYMGPLAKKPEFPIYDFYDRPGYKLVTSSVFPRECNWIQMHDNMWDPAHLRLLHAIPGNLGFHKDILRPGEWEFIESPIGLVEVDTRRVGDLVWVRVGDYIPPNLATGQDIEEGVKERAERDYLSRPDRVAWTVPADDENTLRFGFRTVYGEVPPPGQDVAFGQTQDRPYEDRQRVPGDDDAQLGQRRIAVHALEHLGHTERGVIKVRNMMREGIHAVERGEDPPGVTHKAAEPIPTYAHDRVLRIPRAPTSEEDSVLLRDIGRKVVEDSLKGEPHS